MGVDRRDYIIYGADINKHYNSSWYEDDEMLPYLEGHSNVEFEIIHDPYSGTYTMAGLVLDSFDYHEGLPFVSISSLDVDEEDHIKVKKFLSKFDENLEPELIVFTHWH